MNSPAPSPPANFAIIGNVGFSLVNFRGPLIEDIVASGHKVFALAPDFDEATRDAVRALGAEPVDYSLSRTGLNPLRDFADCFRLYKKLRGLNVDCVLSYAIKPVIYGTFAAALARVPRRHALIAGLGYAFDPDQKTLKHRLTGTVASRLYRRAFALNDRIFVQNPADRVEIVERKLARSGQIVPVPGTGVDLAAWQPAPPVTSPVTFLLAARLLAAKGIFQFVEAARALKASHPGLRFVLAGGLDANPGSLTESVIRGWVDEGLIEWPGHVDVRQWLAQASVFVLPSYYREGVPRSTQEAMAMGRPIITTDAPGCRETVIEGENGFLVPPRDADALAAAMQRFIIEPGLIASMGQRSRAYAEEKFDVRKVNATMIRAMGL